MFLLYLWIGACLALNLLMGRWEFAGFDLSPLIDSGWRVLRGQVPNVDFICTFPPSTYLATDLAFRLFGVRWFSILLAEDLLYLVLCLLGLRVCSILLSRRSLAGSDVAVPTSPVPLAWIYVAAQSIVLLCVNHLWHSTTASGFAAYAILTTYALLQPAGWRRSKQSWELTAHLSFAFAVLIVSKPNTSWPTILLCLVCLLLSRQSRIVARVAALVALSASALADTLVLTLFHISPADALRGYSGLSARAIPRFFLVGIHPLRSRPGEITVTLTYLLLALPAYRVVRVAWERRSRLRESSAEFVALGAGGVTLIGLGTNWDVKVVDVPPLLVGAALLALFDPAYRRVLRPLRWSVALLCVFALVVGLGRLRMQADGAWAGSPYGKTVWLQDRFFGHLKTHRQFAVLLNEVDSVVRNSPGQRIFFGPRMEFLYAREGLPSPLHVPLWWHPGTSYPVSQQAAVEQAWLRDDFDILIFARGDRTLFPEKLLPVLTKDYRLAPGMDAIDVYYRVPGSQP